MNNDELILRQQRLQMRSMQLRLSLAEQVQVLKRPLAIADQTRKSLQWLSKNPKWPLVALLVLIVLRPRRSIIWGGRLWWAWSTTRRMRDWLAKQPLKQFFP